MARKYVSFEELTGRTNGQKGSRTTGGVRQNRRSGWTHFDELTRLAASQPSTAGDGVPTPQQVVSPRRTPFKPTDMADSSLVVDMFERFREAGLAPHPYGPEADPTLAEILSRSLGARRKEGSAAMMPSCLVPEERVEPDPSLGFCNPVCRLAYTQPDDPGDRTVLQYGWAWDMVADVARCGGGVLRHVNIPDLAWSKLFDEDEDQIPRPDDLYEDLVEDSYGRFVYFTFLTLLCWATGVRLVPILFEYGGGNNLNQDDASYDNADRDSSGFLTVIGHTPRGKVKAGRPDHQHDVIVPARQGWDPFYWDLDGYHRSKPQEVFQRFALNVLLSPGEASSSPYMAEASRRKCLAVAAYGQAVGEYLAFLAGIYATVLGTDLARVLPAFEVGNEMDFFWQGDRGGYGALEMGRLHALVAGPLRQQYPAAVFRTPDLWGYFDDDAARDWPRRVAWLRSVIADGVVGEIQRWNSFFSESNVRSHEYADWTASMDAAGFHWPKFGRFFQVGELVHQVGFHFFRCTDQPSLRCISKDRYLDETALGADVATLLEMTASLKRAHGLTLSWTLSAMTFQAEAPTAPAVWIDANGTLQGDAYLSGCTPQLQAGYVARRLLYARCLNSPPEFCLWYTMMARITDIQGSGGGDTWGQFDATGVRNELFDKNPRTATYEHAAVAEDFRQGTHAWRRPAWFTLRRVAWLFSETRSCEMLLSDGAAKAVLLRLTSSGSGFGDPQTIRAPRVHRYAYIAWLDQESGLASFSFVVTDRGDGSYEILSLVPDVDYSALDSDVQDENGYPAGEVATWRPNTTATVVRGDGQVTVTVKRSGAGNPAPNCLLTNGRLTQIGPWLPERLLTEIGGPDPAVEATGAVDGGERQQVVWTEKG